MFALQLALCVPGACLAEGGVLAGQRTWSGLVRVDEDVLVPAGSSLQVLAGTRVLFATAASTKTDPAFWSPETELAVAGRLEVLGRPENPVVFEGEGPWGGVVAAPGAHVLLEGVLIRGADEGLLCVGAECGLGNVRIEDGEYGLVLGPGARAQARDAIAVGCRVGVYDARSNPALIPGFSVEDALDAPRLVLPPAPRDVSAVLRPGPEGPRVEYVGEYTVETNESWRGEVIVSGRVTVVPGAVLTLEPGTRVAFRKVDTNWDGMGEGELLVLGGIRSLGEPGKPVVFESAQLEPAPGDWDKVSLIAAEDPDNLFRYTVFRHGVQALHAHFSRFVARGCFFEGNLRATQFQESEDARVEGCVYVGNKQGLRFRDSRVRISGSVLFGNLYGVHAFRCELDFVGNTLEGNALGGFLAKENRLLFQGNRVVGNRDGARMRDPDSFARVRGNRLADNAEDSLSLSHVQGLVEGNLIQGAGLDLVSLEDSAATFRQNEFGRAGRHALHLKGSTDVDARDNYWGREDPSDRIYDREDEPGLGSVDRHPHLFDPPILDLPPKAW